MFFGIPIWLLMAFLSGKIAAQKGYPFPFKYAILGLVLGPIGLMIVAIMPQTETGQEQDMLDRKIYYDQVRNQHPKACPQCNRECAATTPVCPRCDFRF
jgi:hypothetical protein